MNWKEYSVGWFNLGSVYFSMAHVSDFVVDEDNEVCVVHMDNDRTYNINGLDNINKFMGYLLGDDN